MKFIKLFFTMVISSLLVVLFSLSFFLCRNIFFEKEIEVDLQAFLEDTRLYSLQEIIQFQYSGKGYFSTERIQKTMQRILFMNFCEEFIKQYYEKERIPKSKQMSDLEITILAESIYEITENKNYKGDKFLPLAFIAVETQFIPSAVGKSGEKSLFQIMRKTSNTLIEKYYPSYIKEHKENDLRLDIKFSVKMWFSYFLEISNYVENVNLNLNNDEFITWVCVSYNCGFWSKGVAHSIKNNIPHEQWNNEYRGGRYKYVKKIFKNHQEIKESFERKFT